MTAIDTTPLLRFENIGKSYGDNRVLDGVSFTVSPGEVVALAGENGAGKSTLMNILFGMPAITQSNGYDGKIYLENDEVIFKTPKAALEAGIGMVHQEFSLIPGFTGTENILLNRECVKQSMLEEVFGPRIATLDYQQMDSRAKSALSKLGVKLALNTLVSDMPVGHKQFLEIAREIDRTQTRILVLDEPTAVLTESEAEVLIESVRNLAKGGLGVIFISHRLREIMNLCDKVVILSDGRKVIEMPIKEASVQKIASYMMQHDNKLEREDTELQGHNWADQPSALEIESFWVDMPGETVNEINLSVKTGEIFGLAGLAGQGKLGVPVGLMGIRPAGGTVKVFGQTLPLNNPKAALKLGLAFVSEDRRGLGLLLEESIEHNIAFSAMQLKGEYLRRIMFMTLRNQKAIAENAVKYINELAIKCAGPEQHTKELSGGNQQKVCLARAFSLAPRLLFVSEPTRGIDVGAKELVLNSIRRYNRESDTTVVITSSELEELRSICHRIAVINEGRVAGILPATAPTEYFGLLMSGEGLPPEANEILMESAAL